MRRIKEKDLQKFFCCYYSTGGVRSRIKAWKTPGGDGDRAGDIVGFARRLQSVLFFVSFTYVVGGRYSSHGLFPSLSMVSIARTSFHSQS